MIVMMMAKTPSLKAASRSLGMASPSRAASPGIGSCLAALPSTSARDALNGIVTAPDTASYRTTEDGGTFATAGQLVGLNLGYGVELPVQLSELSFSFGISVRTTGHHVVELRPINVDTRGSAR